MSGLDISSHRLFGQWVRATWTGWALGVPFIIALALAGEAAGIGGAQALVGVGMGTGIRLMQGRAIRGVLHRSASWFWSCVAGLGVPFLAADIAKAAGWDFTYSLYVSVALGGFIVGIWQAFILRSRFHNAGGWVLASALGWTLAAGAAAVADALPLRRLWGAVAYLATVAVGGLILSSVTGISLVRLLRKETPA